MELVLKTDIQVEAALIGKSLLVHSSRGTRHCSSSLSTSPIRRAVGDATQKVQRVQDPHVFLNAHVPNSAHGAELFQSSAIAINGSTHTHTHTHTQKSGLRRRMAVVQGRMRRVTSLKRIVESIEDVEYPPQGSLLAQRPRCRTHRARRKREP